MNLKIFFGIIIPAVLIVILTIISSIDAGFSVDRTFIHDLNVQEVFENGNLRSSIEIGKIRLENDYFLPKRYEISYTTACLVDEDGTKEPQDAGYLSYSEGDSSSNYGYYDSYSYSSGQETSIEIGADKSKTVKIYLNPQNLYAYEYGSNLTQQEIIIQKYGDYDALVLVESGRNTYNYNSCYSLSESELEDGTRISLK